jgi:MazG family protein
MAGIKKKTGKKKLAAKGKKSAAKRAKAAGGGVAKKHAKGRAIPRSGAAFEKLAAVMHRLRAPGGCPWDREQSHESLRTYLIEEAYEVLEALDAKDDAKFADELGDLLLQVLFHAEIAWETGRFDIEDVIRNIHDKMVRRHPHVFGTTSAKDSAEVLRNWEQIKKAERAAKGLPEKKAESLLDGVAKGLPALMEGFQLTRKAARAGFDWHSVDGIFEKLEEEAGELKEVLHGEGRERIEGEVGDVLFVAVNLARFLHVDPEIAMKKANAKFARRFKEMEKIAREDGGTFATVPREKMEELWDDAKRREVTT